MTRAIHTDKLAECKKCHSKAVTWAKSRRTGKFYLTEVFQDADGDLISDRTDFHSAYCGDDAAHAAKQSEILKDKQKQDALEDEREERNDAESAQYFLALHDLCKTDVHAAEEKIVKMRSRLDRIREQPTSMDFFTDHMRERAEVTRLNAEIAFMEAAMGRAPAE